MIAQAPVGKHVTLDMFGCACDLEILKFWLAAAPIVNECAKHFTILGIDHAQFQPCGWSATVLLSESHLSFHTWPDSAFVSADLYSCGQMIQDGPIQVILDGFKPKKTVKLDIIRGTLHPQFNMSTLGVDNTIQSSKR